MRATNLSLGGMFLEDEQPPRVGDRVMVALETGTHALQLGEAEVVWRRSGSSPGGRLPLGPLGCGLRFLALGPTGRSLVEAVVRHGGTSSVMVPALSPEEPTKPEISDDEPGTDPGTLLN
jgi:PilZ domain